MSTLTAAKSKKITAIVIAAMMFLMILAVLPMINDSKVYGAGETAQVTASLLNVRSGAGTDYSRIGSLAKGKTFTVTGSAKDRSGITWYKLKYGSKNGYVSSKYVNIKSVTVTSISNTNGTVKNGPLNVRSGPGTKYGKLGLLANGKTFAITGKAKDISGVWWYRLTYSGKSGYVHSGYVTTKSTAATVTAVTDTTGTVKADVLNVRSGPGASYSILGSLKKGKTIAITGKAKASNGVWWYQFTYSGKTGYACATYVTAAANPTPTPEPTEPSEPVTTEPTQTPEAYSATGTVNTSKDPLNVRSGPGTGYGTIGSLAKGKSFDITDKVQDSSGIVWYKLTYNGKTGYVSSSYVKVSETGEAEDGGGVAYEPVTFQMGTATASSGLNVRKGPGTGYGKLTLLAKGTSVTIIGSAKASDGKLWYKYQYTTSTVGYICSDYVTVKTVTSDSKFEAYMAAQGFPESYKPGLRALHASHPQWVFKAVNVGYTWSNALAKETAKVNTNLVSSSSPVSYRSTASGSYNSSTKTWKTFDGGWYAAKPTVVAYYMDPRNFLSESGIYQFMTHRYDSGSQNANTVAAVITSSFMAGKNPGGGYSSYAALINAAGKTSGVNPNVLAAMIVQEQGWSGSSLVSGKYAGYAGYYNFFNIGAYTTSTMNAVQRGLWYAKGGNDGSTSYSRPWNTPYKSILGGAQFYSGQYVSSNQDSYYTKKFNVKNGIDKVATHQYMTNVAGAASEGAIVKKAYSSNSNYPVVFELPVYKSMPASACPLP